MATKFNSKSPTIKRILREASELSLTPSPDYHASPASDANLFEWHFTLRGPPSSAFAAGIYHGRIILPPTYPLRPPSFRFLTPSGRFETNREICLSISGHHEETWQPAWGIRTALVALRAFMETDAKGQLGGLDTSEKERKRCAEGSGSWKCTTCGRSNEDILRECEEAVKASEGEGMERVEEIVPEGLVIGSREDLGLSNKKRQGSVPEEEDVDTEEAELAEGFVQTAPQEPYQAARPGQTVPQPTAALSSQPRPIPAMQTNPPVALAYQRNPPRVSADGVPIWIDRAIAGVVICLFIMSLKVLLGI